MKQQDVMLKMEQLRNRLGGIRLMQAANSELFEKKKKEIESLQARGDYDAVLEALGELQKLIKQQEFIHKLVLDIDADAKRLFIGVYGPAGGALYDALRAGLMQGEGPE